MAGSKVGTPMITLYVLVIEHDGILGRVKSLHFGRTGVVIHLKDIEIHMLTRYHKP